LTVLVEVVLGGVLGMLAGTHMMGVGEMRVVSGLLMVARIVVFCGFRMMMSCHAVMMGRGAMLVRCLF
jgi:hypothetical protein